MMTAAAVQMQPMLEPRHRSVLHGFLRGDTLIVLDYDGTLAPIVEDRERARMRAISAAILHKAALRYRICVLSGRSRADVARLMKDVPLAAIVGNHGAETGLAQDDQDLRPLVQEWLRMLAPRLQAIDGVELEDKGYSVSIHFRKSRRADAEQLICEAAQALPGARLIGGKKVVNVLPAGAPDKAAALGKLCERFAAGRCIFVGDDITDEVVFQAPYPLPVLGIRVGPSAESAAPFFLRDQDEMDDLLREIASWHDHRESA